ncbi:DegT/DnrJ/EryC1/StrS family aminotransferase [uncultured Ruegeria sp.]|uniref:DegT/DnrJ/EryC1/StrS family aminotransferase n=1 Tax=uncultured Ruegeria sp. TaxID=259304 RepID=UPI002616131F|nr:DegT/DnrJ/EryC1/StrS family aminotransferase [uncultured Ruegeria sp.]
MRNGTGKSTLYCDDPSMRLANLFRRDPAGGFMALFRERSVFWSFNTRVAIRAACDLLELKSGDEVLVPAYNCGSEIDPLIDADLSVRLYPVTENLLADPARIEPLITRQTRAIYVTHYFGVIQPALAELRALCDRHGLRLIEDCALSLLSGASPAEGRVGDVSVFCFHKFVPVLEGGALVVNAADLALAHPFSRSPPRKKVAKKLARAGLANVLGQQRIKRLKRALRGPDQVDAVVNTGEEQLEDIPSHYYFDPTLRNARMSVFASRPLRAFSVSEAISARRAHWERYRNLLDGMVGVRMLLPELASGTCPLNMPIMVADRDRIVQQLQSWGIGATPWWAGFNSNLNWTGQDQAMAIKNSVVALPLHQSLTGAHVDYIVFALKEALAT